MSVDAIRAKILGASTPLCSELVVVPEWGITAEDGLYVRELTGTQLDEYQASRISYDEDGKAILNAENMRAKLLSLALTDGDGKPVFAAADVEALGKLSGRALDRLFAVAQRLSGLDAPVKNSPTPSGSASA